jgi:hypothetical protein
MTTYLAQNYSVGDNGADDSTFPYCSLECLTSQFRIESDWWDDDSYEFDEGCANCGLLVKAAFDPDPVAAILSAYGEGPVYQHEIALDF